MAFTRIFIKILQDHLVRQKQRICTRPFIKHSNGQSKHFKRDTNKGFSQGFIWKPYENTLKGGAYKDFKRNVMKKSRIFVRVFTDNIVFAKALEFHRGFAKILEFHEGFNGTP